jgi:hypothetical protein
MNYRKDIDSRGEMSEAKSENNLFSLASLNPLPPSALVSAGTFLMQRDQLLDQLSDEVLPPLSLSLLTKTPGESEQSARTEQTSNSFTQRHACGVNC